MSVGPIDNGRANPVDAPTQQDTDTSTGNHSVDEAVAAFQAAIAHFMIHGNPASISEVAKGALEVDNALRTSNLSTEQREAVLSNLKASILDSGLPDLDKPSVAAEADDLFSHLLPSTLLDFPAITALVDESNTESHILSAAGRVDTAQSALEDAKKALESDPTNEALKEKVQDLIEQYFNELLHLSTTLNEHAPPEGIQEVSGLKSALDEVAALTGE